MQARNIETWQETSNEDQWMMDWKKPEGSGPKKIKTITIKTITKNFSFIFIFNFETMQLRLYCPFNCNKTLFFLCL